MRDGDDEHRDSGTGEPAVVTATPLEDWPKPAKLPAGRRVVLWLRQWRLWKVLRALRGPRLQFGSEQDFENERIADAIKKWARRAAYWLLVPAASAKLYFLGQRVLGSATDLDGSLKSVLAAAALTSGFLAAGLMAATSQTKELRRRRVDDLRQCQEELQPVQRAFQALMNDLQNRPKPAFDAKSAALRAGANWHVGKSLERFIDNIRRVALGWHEHGEYFGGGRLITVEQIIDIERALSDMSGVLYRRKHFMYLVEDLTGTPAGDVHTLDGLWLTKWGGVKYALNRFRPQSDDSWQLLSFWEDLIKETHQLAMRTLRIAVEVHYHNLTQLRVMFAHLAWLTVIGVGVPLMAVTFPTLEGHKPGLLMVAVGGLLLILASTLVTLYRWITQRRLHDEGRLEV